MTRNSWVASILALIIVQILWFPNSSAMASPGACVGSASNYHDGYQKDPARGQVYGATAVTTVRGSAHCTMGSSSNFNNAYSMVLNATHTGWAQTGYIYYTGSVTYDFAQMNRGAGYTPINYYPGVHRSAGDQVNYRAQYESSCTCLRSYVAGAVVLSSSGWNPTSAGDWGTSGWLVEWSSEAAYKQNSIPGTNAARNDWSSMQYLSSVFSWTAVDCTLLVGYNADNPGNWAQNSAACDHKQTWTINP